MSVAPNGESKAIYSKARMTFVEGEQGGGKTGFVTALVVDAYFMDSVRIFCRDILKKDVVVKSYNDDNRIAKVIIDGKELLIRIPHQYKLKSPMRIFCNYHLYGIPYVYCPSFGHILKWLKADIITDGWLIIDEAQVGAAARDSMTKLGKELNKQNFQMRKMGLDMVVISPLRNLVERFMRTIATRYIYCTHDDNTGLTTVDIRNKGDEGVTSYSFNSIQYRKFFWTRERIVA